MTLGGKGLCAYNLDMRSYDMGMRIEDGGGVTSNIEPDYIIHVHVATASRDEIDQLLLSVVHVRGYHVCKTV